MAAASTPTRSISNRSAHKPSSNKQSEQSEQSSCSSLEESSQEDEARSAEAEKLRNASAPFSAPPTRIGTEGRTMLSHSYDARWGRRRGAPPEAAGESAVSKSLTRQGLAMAAGTHWIGGRPGRTQRKLRCSVRGLLWGGHRRTRGRPERRRASCVGFGAVAPRRHACERFWREMLLFVG